MTTAKVTRRRFTVQEYHLMAEAGILHEDDRVELIKGEIVEMAPIGSNHAGHVNRLISLFTPRLGASAVVSIQNPIHLWDDTEPEPDLALLRPRDDFYTQSHPTPEDILLVVEVADSSRDYDRQVKVPMYAEAGIVETWVVDLVSETIEVYRQPTPEGYRLTVILGREDRLSPAALPDLELKLSQLLGVLG